MKKSLATAVAALIIACIVPATRAATIIYHEDFDVNSSAILNGIAPDVDNNGGTNTWTAYTGYKQSGVLPTASVNLGAFLPFTPVANNLYTLSASFTGITGTSNNNGWFAFGFGKGIPTTPQTGDQRFVSGPTVGRAWNLIRGNNTTAPNKIQIGTATNGAPTTPPAPDWTSNGNANGGNLDMKIVLDTSTTPYQATFYATRPGDPLTQVSVGALAIINPADIGAIGIARSTNTAGSMSGNITTFDLSVEPVPEPASSLLLALGIALGATVRRKS